MRCFVKRRARARAREAACAVCRSRRRDYYSPFPLSPTNCIPSSPLLFFSCSRAAAISPRSSPRPLLLLSTLFPLLPALAAALLASRRGFTLVMYVLYTYTHRVFGSFGRKLEANIKSTVARWAKQAGKQTNDNK